MSQYAILGPEKSDHGEDCPVICEANCHNETELECPGGEDEKGCKMQDLCVQKGFGNNAAPCDGFCPVKCKDNENECEQPQDPVTNCPSSPICVPKDKSSNGDYCDLQQCPLICQETEHPCHGDETSDGCKKADVCVTKGTSLQGETCPGTCPISCENGWIKCDGVIDYTPPFEHCKGQDICHVKAKDENMEYCPDSSASHGCPKTCPDDHVLCPAETGILGCKEEEVCRPRSKNDDEEYCPQTADCPTVCKPMEVNCPGGTDDNGCKNPDLCIENNRDFNGDLCPVHCPQNCDDEQVFCPGTRSPVNGCHSADQCKNKGTHKWGETPGDPCPGWCPGVCADHEILCPSGIDPCNGCPTEEVCREAIKDINGMFCPGKEFTLHIEGEDFRENGNRRGGLLSASHNCPVYCREDIGEIQCPVFEDALGCKPEALCVKRVRNKHDSDWCPSTSVCPKECPFGKKLCENKTKDAKGCKIADICVDTDTEC